MSFTVLSRCISNTICLYNASPSYRVSAFIPDPARVYGCQVLELTKNGISEDDAMSVANVRAFFSQSSDLCY